MTSHLPIKVPRVGKARGQGVQRTMELGEIILGKVKLPVISHVKGAFAKRLGCFRELVAKRLGPVTVPEACAVAVTSEPKVMSGTLDFIEIGATFDASCNSFTQKLRVLRLELITIHYDLREGFWRKVRDGIVAIEGSVLIIRGRPESRDDISAGEFIEFHSQVKT